MQRRQPSVASSSWHHQAEQRGHIAPLAGMERFAGSRFEMRGLKPNAAIAIRRQDQRDVRCSSKDRVGPFEEGVFLGAGSGTSVFLGAGSGTILEFFSGAPFFKGEALFVVVVLVSRAGGV